MELLYPTNFTYESQDGQFVNYNRVVKFYCDEKDNHHLTMQDGSFASVAFGWWRNYTATPIVGIKPEVTEPNFDPTKVYNWVSIQEKVPEDGMYVALVKDENAIQGLRTDLASVDRRGYWQVSKTDGDWETVEVLAYLPFDLAYTTIKAVRNLFGNGEQV